MRYFSHILATLTLALFLFSCDNTTQLIETSEKISILPSPKEISPSNKMLVLSERSKYYSSSEALGPLLQLFQLELKTTTGVNLMAGDHLNTETDMIFEVDSSLEKEEYQIDIGKTIEVKGGSYGAMAMAKSTLLQLAKVQDGKLAFPVFTLRDYPDASYRGLLIDLARSWHSVESIKKLIDLAAFYKSNYLHLHFTDYQSYTLPSDAYPQLATPGRSYSKEDLEELESYSQLRGVTIIPELEVPGHSSPLVQMYPEIFAIQNVKDNPWIIHMGREEVYETLDVLIGEITQVFSASPYFHIGGDETILNRVVDDPEVKAYMEKHDLGEDVHELYRHFLVRLNEIVKGHKKKMCVWEGFRREGKIEIPRDILVFEFETNRYLPNHLIEDGYTVVNTSWKPTYVVNQKKWEPKTIYKWNIWRWENWFDKAPSIVPIQLEESDQIIGAQMCSWEQAEELEIPSLRKRLPAMNERIWNTHEAISYDELMSRLEQSDPKLSLLVNDDRQDSLLLDYNFVK